MTFLSTIRLTCNPTLRAIWVRRFAPKDNHLSQKENFSSIPDGISVRENVLRRPEFERRHLSHARVQTARHQSQSRC